MVSLHEQIAPLAFATPPPAIEVTEPRHPADGKAFRTLLVGAFAEMADMLERALTTDYGIRILKHWKAERSRTYAHLPDGTELVVIISSAMSHSLFDHAIGLARKEQVDAITIPHKKALWGKQFSRFGIVSPPPFRVGLPKLTAIPREAPGGDAPAEGTSEPIEPVQDKPAPWGACLKTCWKAAGISQKTLGEKCGVTEGSVSNWSTGKTTPDFQNYKRLLEHLPLLRSFPPPPTLEGIVFAELAPPPQAIAEQPVITQTLSPLASLGVQ